MTTADATDAAVRMPTESPVGAHRATVADAFVSEWVKLRSLRSTWITLAIAFILGVGLGVLIAHLTADAYQSAHLTAVWDPATFSLAGLGIAQLAMAVFGALAITGEYGTGMIRTSLTVVPQRGRFLGAKAAVLATLTVVTGEVIAFAAFFLGQLVIGGAAPQASIGGHNVLRAVVGAGLYLAVIAVLACALGFVVRNTAAAIAIMVALIFVLPGILAALPPSWSHPIHKYWPTQAGAQVYIVIRTDTAHTLSAWAGFGDLCLFTAIVLAVAYWLLRVRNA